ncbi:MAG TPA: hypothetical protein VF269_07785 [Rhodanobacteraceae bacterium]
MSKRKPKGESHVRVYAHEMRVPAWQTLDVDARALLLELRALYRPSQGNVVFLSLREAMRRLHIGQRRAQHAFAALIERGWISIAAPGGFSRKTRHATSYRLENESTGEPNSIPRKPYMRWQPEKTR